MALDNEIKQQLSQYLALLEGEVEITLSIDDSNISKEMRAFVEEIAQMDRRIKVTHAELERTPSFRVGERIIFAGIPLGHEFSSFIMALLQVSGRAPKITEGQKKRIESIATPCEFVSYISLSCHNCPDVVQSLNILAVLNPQITHTMVDGSIFNQEVESKNIMAVPSVMNHGQNFANGRMTLDDVLNLLSKPEESKNDGKSFDMLIVGGGPAGASAAIYAARKGIKVGIVAERFGGQVADTIGIENLIGTTYTEGPKLVASLEAHVQEYSVDVMKGQRVKKITKGKSIQIELANGDEIRAKTVIVATGAKWRTLNVPGEVEFKNKGVAYCPHCDGPIFKGKRVAVVGGGNSGVEAAIDLAGIVEYVTLFEYGDTLKADQVLQDRLYSLKNATVIKNAQTKEIKGDHKVNGLVYIDRLTQTEHIVSLEGVFVQIGLVPNTEWLDVDKNKFGEVLVDSHNATNMPGVFAAGDCTNIPYKQIIISMGAGATASLSAFDYLIRHGTDL